MNKLSAFYLQFWYHTEFWLTRKNRRPYTFIMRDWIYRHGKLSFSLILSWFLGMIVLSVWHGTATTISSILTGLLTAHLVWGAGWIEGQQEFPEYIEPEPTVTTYSAAVNVFYLGVEDGTKNT